MYFIIYKSWDDVPCDFLPRDMNNLFNLRYAELPWRRLRNMHWIGELRPFQRLNRFFVKDEAGYRLNELEHMNELCQLNIYQLQNVKDAEEACNAKFCDKGSLTELSLQWGDNEGHRKIVHSNLDEEVFDNLQPHNNLKQLAINAYRGTRSAKWMNEVNFLVISNLEYIKLEGCLEWVTLPPFGQLRLLKSLYLHKMPKARSIDSGFHTNDEDCAFPSLKVLHIEDLDALEDWFDATAANDSLFPCLTELCLERCPNLQVLPSLPPKLQKLKMFKIRWKGFSWLQDTSNSCEVHIQDCGDFPGIFSYFILTTESGQFSVLRICDPSELLMEPLRSITSVAHLIICENDKLDSFPKETEEWFLQVSASLRKLNFSILESMNALPSFLKSLSSLEYLDLSNIPLLKSLPDLPSSLEELQLRELKSLQRLPSLSNILSLKRLSLEKIPLLTSLLDLSSSLEKLSIQNLESLECLPSSLSTFSSLKYLNLSSIPLLKSLTGLPSSLENLSIQNLESLECLPSSLSTFSSLKILELSSIPLLKSLPVLPPSIEELSIENLESLECLPSSLWTFSSLSNLELSSIPLLKSLPVLPPSIEELSIENLESLECLPSSLWTFSSLSNLELSSIPLLKSLSVPPSLIVLVIQNLESLECLPSSLSTTCLWRLRIHNVPLLQQLPDLPSSLESLWIIRCHEELKKRYDKISGFDRDKVAHIRYVIFDESEDESEDE